MNDLGRLRRVLGYLFDHAGIFAAGVVCVILFGACETAVPWLMYMLLDADQPDFWVRKEDLPWVMPALLVLVFVARGVLGFIRGYWSEWLHHTISRDIRRDLLRKLVSLPKGYHDRESSGVLISRVMQFVDQMIQSTTGFVVSLFQELARLAGYLGTMFYFNWRYTLVVLVAMPFTLMVIAAITKRVRKFAGLQATALSDLTGSLGDTIQGQTVVKSFGGERREYEKLEGHLARVRGMGLRQGVALALNMPLSQLFVAMAVALVFSLLAGDLVAGRMTKGEATSFIFAMALVPLPIRNLARLAALVRQSMAASAKVFDLIDAEPEDLGGEHAPKRARGEISFEGVGFTYPHEDGRDRVIDGLDLSVSAGETVALVGPSGGGKTTLTSLLLAFYRPDAGRVALDGVDLREWSLPALRKNVAFVSQEVVLFDTTVAENVAYPAVGEEIDRKRLERAIRSAQADALVASMDKGVDTLLGERGLRLSGGERQRISIARAFYRDAPVLVLDEATSSLDSRTEDAVKESLRKLLEKRTAIIIAHRFATVDIADRVLVMEGGRIVAEGTHAELMERSGLYRNLYESQRLEG